MLIFIGLCSTILSLYLINNGYKEKEEQMSKRSAQIYYTQDERDTWKKEYIRMYILALLPIIICTMCQVVRWSL